MKEGGDQEMVLKWITERNQGAGRVLFDLTLLLVAASAVFNVFAWSQLNTVANRNNHNGEIIKAATGCADSDTVDSCKKLIAANGQKQITVFLQEEDCWTRRALMGLPIPPNYDTPCQVPGSVNPGTAPTPINKG